MTETKMQLEDWLDDLCVRFIINLPREELESVERICFQVEEAQWFYEDFIRPLDPALPSMNLKTFAMRIFQHCPLMSSWSHYHHLAAFQEFLDYKTRVPVRGAIMLNQDMDEVVLVKGWKKGANWSFPRGKINKGEKDLDCAIREVYEETGFDVRDADLVKDADDVKYIEITMREQHMRLYVFRGVPRDTYFEPRTRKEISKIEWYKLSDLPTLKKSKQHDEGLAVANANKFYMVAPFLNPLKKWIAQQKRLNGKVHPGTNQVALAEGYASMDENGHINGIAKMGIPSDLPELASVQDASDHLKRLLKIGAAPVQAQTPGLEPVQTSPVDPSKANALLALLQRGGQKTSVQNPASHPMMSPRNVIESNVQTVEQRPHLGPNFFPGFPQQQQNMGPSPFMRQNSTPFHAVPSQPHIQPSQNAPHLVQGNIFPTTPHTWYPTPHAIPQFPQGTTSSHYQHHNQPPLAHGVLPPSHMPAPFQRTGDPEFSESAQLSENRGPVVPPASKLPPPKLTSHSLALLEAFKVKTPKGPAPATLAAPVQGSSQLRKTSQHQDSLLGLLKAPQATRVPEPVELSGNPIVPPTAPSEKQILQRPLNDHNQLTRGVAGITKSRTGAGRASATVSGPLNMPQLEAIPKPTYKSMNGTNIKNHVSRREQPLVQQLSSPITILSRPQSAKREASSPKPVAQATQVTPETMPRAPKPIKNFQPQILRRSDQSGYEALMAAAPRAEAVEPKPSLPVLEANTQGLAPQSNFDRRPSQTAEQKASLLSLFSKAPASPSGILSTPFNSQTIQQQPAAFPGLVSPISSRHRPSSGDSISRQGTPSDGGAHVKTHSVSSPNNKAFLLGFLEGVAKANK
ncbi:mRNA decapping protein 2 Box A [Penicillium paradoxum]|uniref:mRNA decapping protein 2 Box A n=1 Tax=Penicillium paradoxum TaxID=176176 RepID=UPI0025491325|nr:mRNA decapping protein 2 Box A [Penicillium paradoxum]KAJ5782476.1 mRNA decapping protein 2 Box A [Penicillium paradoxum]